VPSMAFSAHCQHFEVVMMGRRQVFIGIPYYSIILYMYAGMTKLAKKFVLITEVDNARLSSCTCAFIT
jgi:hypothetical protein